MKFLSEAGRIYGQQSHHSFIDKIKVYFDSQKKFLIFVKQYHRGKTIGHHFFAKHPNFVHYNWIGQKKLAMSFLPSSKNGLSGWYWDGQRMVTNSNNSPKMGHLRL